MVSPSEHFEKIASDMRESVPFPSGDQDIPQYLVSKVVHAAANALSKLEVIEGDVSTPGYILDVMTATRTVDDIREREAARDLGRKSLIDMGYSEVQADSILKIFSDTGLMLGRLP